MIQLAGDLFINPELGCHSGQLASGKETILDQDSARSREVTQTYWQ